MNFKAVLALPKTAHSAQTHKSISFIWIVWSTLYVYLCNQHKTFDLLQIYFNICPWVKISPKILFSFQKSSHYEWGGLQNYFPVGYRRTFIVFHQFHWTDWQFLVGGQKFKTACPESVSSFTACPCNIWYSKSSQTFTLWFFSNYI